jgi:7-keto-8-aminopelargonate synthetase-like enzyme
MYSNNFYDQFRIDKHILDILNFNPYYARIESGTKGTLKINGESYIDLASNNYLGLASDQRVITSIIRAVEQYGASLCGTPIATGSIDLLSDLENEISVFLGLEATALFPSCYQANLGLFLNIASSRDLILVDHFAHASLINGIQSIGCKIMPFLHNDMTHLEKLLKKSSGYRNRYVVTESVFSTEGSIAPFDLIVELCTKYDAIPIIDDSHGIGVLGTSGKGILEEKEICDYYGIYTASLGKAIANIGGVISGKKGFIDYLKYSCAGLIYSTALTPGMLGGIRAVLQIIESEYAEIKQRLKTNKKILQYCLNQAGLEHANGEAMIVSLKTGTTYDTIDMAKKLFKHKILSTPFVPPSVPPNKGIVRLIPGAAVSGSNMQKVTDAIRKIAVKSKMQGWERNEVLSHI